MIIENVDTHLTQIGITKIPLNILKEDGDLSDIYLFQPIGNIQADANGISITSINFETKIENFISSFSQNADLLVTPEYCCPWSLVGQINAGGSPKSGGLWALGFQSITPNELQTIIEENINIRWIVSYPAQGTYTFLNPLIYFFKGKDDTQVEHTVAVVQFKTNPMVDTISQIERTHLICGNTIYTFSNHQYGTHLASIICSDALNNFDPSTLFPQWINLPFILLHPQMNTDPTHDIFRDYRSKWANKNGDKKQIICLNWAKGTQINNVLDEASFGRSCFLTKDNPQVGRNDHNDNHKKGFYYTYSKKRVHSFYLNFDEYSFHLKSAKVGRGEADAASANFACPKCVEIYSWQIASSSWIATTTTPNDNYQQSCPWMFANYACLEGQSLTPVDKEVIVNWATGKLGGTFKDFSKLDSVAQSDSEKIRRITFAQDLSAEAAAYRQSALTLFTGICVDILPDITKYPTSFIHFYPNHRLEFNGNRFTLANEEDKALVCFIGDATDEEVEKCYTEACKNLHENDYRKICIWYRRFGAYLYKITIDNNITTAFESPIDITRE